MQVYRAEEAEAARLVQILGARGVRAQVERYGPDAVYVVVSADRPEIVRLALTAGRTVRRIPTFKELADSE